MTDYSFSYSATTSAPTPKNEALWSFNQTDILPGPGNTVFLHAQHTGAGMLVQPDVARALELCPTFRTLEAHTQHVLSLLPALRDHGEHTRQTLRSVGQQGLMESSEAAWQRLTAHVSPGSEKQPCRLFIMTCDRPEALKRLLLPLVAQLSPETTEGLWVIDDSRSQQHAQENAAIVETGKPGSAVPIHYFGERARTSLINQLSEAAPEHRDSIGWLLDRTTWGKTPTYGLARNLALLLSVGKRALMLDDDTLPEAISPPKTPGTLRFAEMNHREATFHSSSEELARHALVLEASPVDLMENALGAPLGALLQHHFMDHRDLQGMNGALIARYGPDSRMLLSQCGSWGDTGSSGLNWLLSLPLQSIRSLVETGNSINETLSPQHCWAGHPAPAITSFGAMSQWTGVDHRTLLPPYLPAGRNEDLLFGIMLQRTHPEAAVFNNEWAIRHAPITPRSDVAFEPANAWPGITLLADWLGREPKDQQGLTPERRLQGLSEEIARLSEMDHDTRLGLVKRQLVGRRCALLNQCVTQIEALETLDEQPGSASWKHFLTESRDRLFQGIQTASLMNEGGEGNESFPVDSHALENHGRQFANALKAWPALCSAAGETDY
ncbi:MAG: hypothetical protein P8M73_08170 [Luminiphilus sp.]|nr:hypothetical protein [Luminiphilus sp.]